MTTTPSELRRVREAYRALRAYAPYSPVTSHRVSGSRTPTTHLRRLRSSSTQADERYAARTDLTASRSSS